MSNMEQHNKIKYLAMIQARCGSTRLPNKVLKMICGKPQLQRVIERTRRSKKVNEVMVITSIEKSNLPILRLCAEIGVRVGVGSENDVLDRYYQTARLIKPQYVIRITGDCPLVDPELIDMAIEMMDDDTDYCGNPASATFADGLDVEVMKYSALELAWKSAKHSFEREHVTQYILRNRESFNVKDFLSPIGFFGDQRWTVDEPEDFVFVQKVYEHFIYDMNYEEFGYKDVLEYINDFPEIKRINENHFRNEGLYKSIEEDVLLSADDNYVREDIS